MEMLIYQFYPQMEMLIYQFYPQIFKCYKTSFQVPFNEKNKIKQTKKE